MRKTAFLYLSEVEVYGADFRIKRVVESIHHLEVFATAYHGDIVVVEINHLVGVFNNRSGVGTEEELVLAYTDDQRTLLAGSDNLVFVSLVEHCNGISSDELGEGKPHCSKQVYVLSRLYVFYELHDDFRIGIRTEFHAIGNEFLLQVSIVLDDAIMNDGDILRL